MDAIEIRDATENDIRSITDIYRTYVRTSIASLEEHEPSLESIRNEFSKIILLDNSLLVAATQDCGIACGCKYTGPFNEGSGYKYTCEDSVYLHPDHCGNGLGKLLLRAVFQKLKAGSDITHVIAKMSILPNQEVEDLPWCRLHLSLGFRTVGRLRNVGYKFGQLVDVVVLQAELDRIET